MSGIATKPRVFPMHGWVPAEQTGKAYVLLPFLGCMAVERERLKSVGDSRVRTFRTNLQDLGSRFIFAVRSVQLWRTIPGSTSGNPWLLDHSLYADLVLYEFACLYDSVARILAHFASNVGDTIEAPNFHAFVGQVMKHERSVQKVAPWMVPLLRVPELAMVKSLRNRRTHTASQYAMFSKPSEGTAATSMSSTEHNGAKKKADVEKEFSDSTKALLGLLNGAAESLAPGGVYMNEDVLGRGFLGLLPSGQWERGAWLEDWLPKLEIRGVCP